MEQAVATAEQMGRTELADLLRTEITGGIETTAEDVFHEYANRFNWEFSVRLEVLADYFGEAILDKLLTYIEEVGLTVDFEAFWGRTGRTIQRDVK